MNSPTMSYDEYLRTCRKIKVNDPSLEIGSVFMDTLAIVNSHVYRQVKRTAFDITGFDHSELVNIALTFFERIWNDV